MRPIVDVLTYYLREKDPGEGRVDNRTRKAFDDLSINVERLLEWWGDKALSEVKRSNCRAYVEHRTAQANRRFKNSITAPRVSPSTARRELEDLASAIAAYHAEYTLDAVPVVSLPPKPPRRQRWLTRTEAALLLWACLGWRYDARVGRLATIPDGNGVRKQVRNRRKHLCRFILIGLYSGTPHMAIVRARWIASADEPHVDTERGLLFRRGSGERRDEQTSAAGADHAPIVSSYEALEEARRNARNRSHRSYEWKCADGEDSRRGKVREAMQHLALMSFRMSFGTHRPLG